MPTPRAATVLACAGLGAGLALAGCSAAPAPRPETGTVTIGVLGSTGDGADGTDAVRGAELAVAVVNESNADIAVPLAAGTGLPGLDGSPLAIAVADTGGQPESTDDAMGQLLGQERLAGVVAADRAGVVEVAAAYADRQRVPMVDGATTAGFLLDIGLEWYFRTGPTDRTLADAVFALLDTGAGDRSGDRLAVIVPPDGRGTDTAGLVGELAATAGFRPTGPLAVAGDLPARLAAEAPDVVVAVAPAPEDGPTLHQAIADWTAAAAVPVDPALAPADPDQPPAGLVVGLGQGFAVSTPGPEIRPGMLHPAAWSAELAGRAPLARTVAELYQARYQTPMTESGARAFTATMALAVAVDTAGTTEPAAVRAALRQLSAPATQTIMPWSGVRFGEDGQNELAAAVVEQSPVEPAGAGDTARLVYPPELAVADLVWNPVPTPEPGP